MKITFTSLNGSFSTKVNTGTFSKLSSTFAYFAKSLFSEVIYAKQLTKKESFRVVGAILKENTQNFDNNINVLAEVYEFLENWNIESVIQSVFDSLCKKCKAEDFISFYISFCGKGLNVSFFDNEICKNMKKYFNLFHTLPMEKINKFLIFLCQGNNKTLFSIDDNMILEMLLKIKDKAFVIDQLLCFVCFDKVKENILFSSFATFSNSNKTFLQIFNLVKHYVQRAVENCDYLLLMNQKLKEIVGLNINTNSTAQELLFFQYLFLEKKSKFDSQIYYEKSIKITDDFEKNLKQLDPEDKAFAIVLKIESETNNIVLSDLLRKLTNKKRIVKVESSINKKSRIKMKEPYHYYDNFLKFQYEYNAFSRLADYCLKNVQKNPKKIHFVLSEIIGMNSNSFSIQSANSNLDPLLFAAFHISQKFYDVTNLGSKSNTSLQKEYDLFSVFNKNEILEKCINDNYMLAIDYKGTELIENSNEYENCFSFMDKIYKDYEKCFPDFHNCFIYNFGILRFNLAVMNYFGIGTSVNESQGYAILKDSYKSKYEPGILFFAVMNDRNYEIDSSKLNTNSFFVRTFVFRLAEKLLSDKKNRPIAIKFLINCIMENNDKKCEALNILTKEKAASYDNPFLTIAIVPINEKIIHQNKFNKNTNLKFVYVSDTVDIIEKSSFSDCNNLEDVRLPNNLKEIDEFVFLFCFQMNRIILPENLVTIKTSAFASCGLKSINFPSTLKSIGSSAFSGAKLEIVRFPSSIEEIKNNAFYRCPFLEEIEFNFSKNDKDHILEIGEGSFSSCASLRSLLIPGNLKNIKKIAFFGCSNLENVEICDGVEFIESDSFGDCVNLKSVSFPSSIKVIKTKAFKGCISLKAVNISKNTTIENNAFENTKCKISYY